MTIACISNNVKLKLYNFVIKLQRARTLFMQVCSKLEAGKI